MTILHTFMSPQCYIQGAGALREAGARTRRLGTTAFATYAGPAAALWAGQLVPSLRAAGITAHGAEFVGESGHAEIEQATVAARIVRANVIIGMGGGIILDAAKAIAGNLGAPLVVIPTVACIDALTSTRCTGCFENRTSACRHAPRRTPDLVLVDTQVIADAPARTFVAGIGDALATWFEARAAAQSYATTAAGGWQTVAAGALAKACWETLRRYAPEAIAAVRAHRVTDAVEKVVEAVILLGGVGSESGGMAAAHPIREGLGTLSETHNLYSGEMMGFALLAQLEMEKHTEQDRREVLAFCRTVGLPVCFADLGLADMTSTRIARVAERALAEGEAIYNEPCALTRETVMEALRSADARGRAAKAIAAVA